MSLIRTIRRKLRPVRHAVEALHIRALELPHLLSRPEIGSAEWLVQREIKYGGYVTNVPRHRLSPHDGRAPEQLATWGMTGGDRMLHGGYAPTYAAFLQPFLGQQSLTIAEFGILKGSGLAIWCDLFPDAHVIGFDIDLSHFEDNRKSLLERGAFRKRQPVLCEYDQLVTGRPKIEKALNGRTLDVVIDDGLHSLDSILMTWRSVKPFLSDNFVYFVEDYEGLLDACGGEFSECSCYSDGMLTVISRGLT